MYKRFLYKKYNFIMVNNTRFVFCIIRFGNWQVRLLCWKVLNCHSLYCMSCSSSYVSDTSSYTLSSALVMIVLTWFLLNTDFKEDIALNKYILWEFFPESFSPYGMFFIFELFSKFLRRSVFWHIFQYSIHAKFFYSIHIQK